MWFTRARGEHEIEKKEQLRNQFEGARKVPRKSGEKVK